MNIEFLATVALIAPDVSASRKLYVDAPGLPLKREGGDYHHSEQIAGGKSFGIWPLGDAAEACFGTQQWPSQRAVPQVSTESTLQTPQRSAQRHGNSSPRSATALVGTCQAIV